VNALWSPGHTPAVTQNSAATLSGPECRRVARGRSGRLPARRSGAPEQGRLLRYARLQVRPHRCASHHRGSGVCARGANKG